jgi:hypothetical protein
MSNKLHILDTTDIWKGFRARKEKGLKAKPVSDIIADKTVIDRLQLVTIEGTGPLTPGAMLCVGPLGDVWQQSPEKLLKKYELVAVGADGWQQFSPKPENEVEFFEVTAALLEELGINDSRDTFIIGQWGQTVSGVSNLQGFKVGDFIARQTFDHSDQWVVASLIWHNTYKEVGVL